jgi:hypothetical protein
MYPIKIPVIKNCIALYTYFYCLYNAYYFTSDRLLDEWQRSQSSSPGREEIFLLTTSSGPVLGPTQPPIQWVSGARSRVKRPGREVHHSPLTSADIKNTWIYTSISIRLFGVVLNQLGTGTNFLLYYKLYHLLCFLSTYKNTICFFVFQLLWIGTFQYIDNKLVYV